MRDLTAYEVDEIKAFCRQYPEKKQRAATLLGVRSACSVVEYTDAQGKQAGVLLPRGGRINKPVEEAAIKRERLLADCALIERCAEQTAGGGWAHALLCNVCYREAYDVIPRERMPSANRGAFYAAKREFFSRIKEAREND